MKATIEVNSGSVRVYSSPNPTTPGSTLSAGAKLEVSPWFAVGAVPREDGNFSVTFAEDGQMDVYEECRDEFGAVKPCGQLGKEGRDRITVAAGEKITLPTHNSNAWTLGCPVDLATPRQV